MAPPAWEETPARTLLGGVETNREQESCRGREPERRVLLRQRASMAPSAAEKRRRETPQRALSSCKAELIVAIGDEHGCESEKAVAQVLAPTELDAVVHVHIEEGPRAHPEYDGTVHGGPCAQVGDEAVRLLFGCDVVPEEAV